VSSRSFELGFDKGGGLKSRRLAESAMFAQCVDGPFQAKRSIC
jgi:hypothetical protein